MPTRGQTIDEAIKLFTGAQYPNGQISKDDAWVGIYQVLLWYESVATAGFTSLPHIIDADKLRLSKYKSAQAASKNKSVAVRIWQTRAKAVEDHIANHLGISADKVETVVDQLLMSPAFL